MEAEHGGGRPDEPAIALERQVRLFIRVSSRLQLGVCMLARGTTTLAIIDTNINGNTED